MISTLKLFNENHVMSAKTSLRHQVISIYFVVEALDFRRLFNRIINTKPTPSLLQTRTSTNLLCTRNLLFSNRLHTNRNVCTRQRNAPPLPSIAAIKSSAASTALRIIAISIFTHSDAFEYIPLLENKRQSGMA